MTILYIAIGFLIGLALGHMVSTYITNKKRTYKVEPQEDGSAIFEPRGDSSANLIEFSPEMDKEELEEATRPAGLRKFLAGFKKIPKEKEDLL